MNQIHIKKAVSVKGKPQRSYLIKLFITSINLEKERYVTSVTPCLARKQLCFEVGKHKDFVVFIKWAD